MPSVTVSGTKGFDGVYNTRGGRTATPAKAGLSLKTATRMGQLLRLPILVLGWYG